MIRPVAVHAWLAVASSCQAAGASKRRQTHACPALHPASAHHYCSTTACRAVPCCLLQVDAGRQPGLRETFGVVGRDQLPTTAAFSVKRLRYALAQPPFGEASISKLISGKSWVGWGLARPPLALCSACKMADAAWPSRGSVGAWHARPSPCASLARWLTRPAGGRTCSCVLTALSTSNAAGILTGKAVTVPLQQTPTVIDGGEAVPEPGEVPGAHAAAG